jgi:hypothetical protein
MSYYSLLATGFYVGHLIADISQRLVYKFQDAWKNLKKRKTILYQYEQPSL